MGIQAKMCCQMPPGMKSVCIKDVESTALSLPESAQTNRWQIVDFEVAAELI